MPTGTQRPTMNGTAGTTSKQQTALDSLNLQLKQNKKYASFHGDALIGVSAPTAVAIILLTSVATGCPAAYRVSRKVEE